MNIVDQVLPARDPAAPALVCDGRTLSYGDLERAVNEARDHLFKAGFPKREPGRVPRIGLACQNGPEHVILALAILRCGGCLVPIAGELTASEREEVVATVALDAILLHQRMPWPERYDQPGTATPLPALEATLFTDLPRVPIAWDEAALARLNPAFIRFSSGTTGRTKGVILSHETILKRVMLANRALAVSGEDRIVWILSMAHHFAVSIMLYLIHGAATVILRSSLAGEILSAGREYGGTVLYGAPFHHALLAAEPSGRPWPSLRLAVSTAAPLAAPIAAAFDARYGVPLCQGLGLIEVGLPLLNTGDARCKPTSVGKPGPGVAVQLRDPQTGLPVRGSEPGELFLQCEGMLDAYLSPWQTREELLAPGGWFRTGDMACWDGEQSLYLVGRCKTVINVGGMKCFPEEVEAVLLRHPGIRAARVHGREHPRFGTVPVAEVVAEGPPPTVAELVALCRQSLSNYKIPATFRFVESLPRTASGKIQRTAAAV